MSKTPAFFSNQFPSNQSAFCPPSLTHAQHGQAGLSFAILFEFVRVRVFVHSLALVATCSKTGAPHRNSFSVNPWVTTVFANSQEDKKNGRCAASTRARLKDRCWRNGTFTIYVHGWDQYLARGSLNLYLLHVRFVPGLRPSISAFLVDWDSRLHHSNRAKEGKKRGRH